MSMIYIAHPFTGNEERNRKMAVRIQRGLQEADPENCYINPLAAFGALEGMDYMEILEQCLELLYRCDEILMTPGWKESRGCRLEFACATAWGKKVGSLKFVEV